MLKLLNHNIILPKYLEMVKKNKPAEKNAVGSEGAVEGGCGGNSAAPERSCPAVCSVRSRSQQKKFSFPFRRKNPARAKEKQRKLFCWLASVSERRRGESAVSFKKGSRKV